MAISELGRRQYTRAALTLGLKRGGGGEVGVHICLLGADVVEQIRVYQLGLKRMSSVIEHIRKSST